MGLGKRPSRTPAHQVDLLTGIGPAGANIELSRRSPVGAFQVCEGMLESLSCDMGPTRTTTDGCFRFAP